MKSFCLGSGSKGNCFYLESSQKKFLVDLGFSFSKSKEILEEKDIDILSLDGVFLTHEHSDHIVGFKSFLKNSDINFYLTKGTFESISKDIEDKDLARFIFVKEYDVLEFDCCKVLVVSKAHDAREPVSYVFESDKRVGVFTDLGHISMENLSILKTLDIVYFEANYCEDLAKQCNLHFSYLNRLQSSLGHLGICQSLDCLKQIYSKDKKFILSHVSQNTNTYENVYSKILIGLEEEFGEVCNLFVSFQDESTDWFY